MVERNPFDKPFDISEEFAGEVHGGHSKLLMIVEGFGFALVIFGLLFWIYTLG